MQWIISPGYLGLNCLFIELYIQGLVYKTEYYKIGYSRLDIRVGYPTFDVHSWTFSAGYLWLNSHVGYFRARNPDWIFKVQYSNIWMFRAEILQDWIFKVGYSILATYLELNIQSTVVYSILDTYLSLNIQNSIFHPRYIFRAGYSK
jgi:hypothetical protein